ncbi:hypothetical protein K493DRAFT_213930 [Basidiobolus meristosporus CBS 931.73]|uniref:NADH-ubiquinone oxidoreductase chain 3 n=1 Tax=Basidiobolus meristosporus CBS 931.73 TaxID=1314790 RepID=A0A1Y1YKS5_9FUNG|nr:hypothetical protein K493DRAFT_213930 [Basidiobolus meristosporus CBS 931.73]|eukprot:ORX98621.1 hypothetical protein K493DRAFT_213930 [Basidiobolus meristosporus CBS 931.73]
MTSAPLSYTVFLVFTPILVTVLLAINLFLGINKPDAQKLSPYECGSIPLGDAREKFSLHFFLVAILFIVFDLEIIMLFPFAETSYYSSIITFWIIVLCVAILAIGVVYIINCGIIQKILPFAFKKDHNSAWKENLLAKHQEVS